jgi:capsular exopolysaccharide synthesis family protein
MQDDPGGIGEYPVLWNQDEEGNVSRASLESVTGRIRRNLTSERSNDESDVIVLSFQSKSRFETAYIVNTAMEIYIENSTAQNRQAAESTAQFLEGEMADLKQKLEDSERRLQEYMDQTGFVQVDQQGSGIVSEQVALETELQQIGLDLQTVNQSISNLEEQMERIRPGLADQFTEAIGPRIRNAQEQLAQYEGERTLIISRNPGVLERETIPPRIVYLDEEISRLKAEIRELSSQLFTEDEEFMGMDTEDRAQLVSNIQSNLVDLRIQKNQLESRQDALTGRKSEIESRFNNLPDGMIELGRLQRDVRINEELYLNVRSNYAEMSVLKQSQFGFGRILDNALIPGAPVSPNKKIYLILGMMLGGVLSAGFVFIKEFTDNSINSVDHLKMLNLPILAAVPVLEKKSKKHSKNFSSNNATIPNELVMLNNRADIASEAMRRLKNNIVFQSGHVPPKTICVTSAEKGDGKSTVVANLAVAFAEEGYKTLVIDTDFRRPNLHNYFGLKREGGLTDYVEGNLPMLKLFRNTDVSSLKVITAGSGTETPERIVNTREFKNFLEKMKETFDIIILDTPPFGVISDSTPLLKSAESTVLVTKYRKTNRGIFVKTLDELERIHANIHGFVLNGFDPKKETGSYYGPGYYETLYSNYESYVG